MYTYTLVCPKYASVSLHFSSPEPLFLIGPFTGYYILVNIYYQIYVYSYQSLTGITFYADTDTDTDTYVYLRLTSVHTMTYLHN